MYETIPGIIEVVDKPTPENNHLIVATIGHVVEKAFQLAIRRLASFYGFSPDQITGMIETKQMAGYDVPKEHPSFSESNDLRRGWFGAMINGELKLLSSYAIRY